MKKNLLMVLLAGFMMFMPVVVNAEQATYSLSLDCPTDVSKDELFDCGVYANIVGAGIKDVKITFETSGTVSMTDTEFTANEKFEIGPNVKIGDIKVKSGTDIGKGEIKVTSAEAFNDDDADPAVLATPTSNDASQEVIVKDDNTNLTGITVDGQAVTSFSSGNRSYNISVSKASVEINATPDSNVTVESGTGVKNLICGANVNSIITRSEDGKQTGTYTLNITRNCNSDATLRGINLSSGTLSPSFASGVNSYRVEVESNIENITITPVRNNDLQSVATLSNRTLNYGENSFQLRVTAESGATSTYTIVVVRKDDRSTDNTLKSLEVSPGKLTYEAERADYKFKVLYEVSKIDVTAVPNDTKAKVEITGGDALVVGENVITIKVTAENETEKTYTITVTRLAEGEVVGDNPLAQSITIDGYDLDFKSETYNYTLKIKNEKELNINIVMQEKGAEYSIRGNSNLENESVITIVTTSEDGTTATYKITIEKDSMLWIIILVIVAVLLIIAVVVLLIIRKKKDATPKEEKDVTVTEDKKQAKNLDKKEVTTTVVADKDLLDKVEKQIKQSEVTPNEDLKDLGETKKMNQIPPISIIKKPEVAPQITRSERFATPEKESPVGKHEDLKEDIDRIIKQEQDNSSAIEKETPTTKICSICGHRVPAEAKVCPYCRRIWK